MSTAILQPRPTERINPLRVAALSGTMVVNILVLAALMLPIAAEPLERAIEDVTVMTWIVPEEIKPIPPVPPPPVIQQRPVERRAPTPPKQPPIADPIDNTPVTTDVAPLPPATLPPVDSVPGPTVDTTPLGNATLAFISRTAPPYPVAAMRKYWEGVVLLRILVDENGMPERVELHDSSGRRELDQAALKQALKWRFVPASREGVPVKAWGLVPVEFKIPRG